MRVKAEMAIDLLERVGTIARQAGAAIMDIYAHEFDVEFKGDSSPLTAADMAAHTAIAEGLAKLEPHFPLLSEESNDGAFAARQSWPTYWLVDPLDGTKEFVKRNGEFTVNIALIEGHEPLFGVVYAPVLDRLYSGIKGVGAWLSSAGGPTDKIAVTQPAQVPVRVVGSRSHASPELAAYLENIGPHELKSMGSSLKICLVAEGEADVYPRLGPTSEWDTAAAHAVLLGAGGQMVDTNGQPLRYNKANLLNPHFIAFGDPDRHWLK